MPAWKGKDAMLRRWARGFTLIELLIVVAIIAILSVSRGFFAGQLGAGSRAKQRRTSRVRTALELHWLSIARGL